MSLDELLSGFKINVNKGEARVRELREEEFLDYGGASRGSSHSR